MTKRNAQGSGTIRQRKDGRWEARYTAGRNPKTGKQMQKSIYGATQKEVLKKLQQINVELEQGTYTEPSRMTVGQWLDVWLNEYTGNIKERTRNEYECSINYRIKPAIGAVKLSALTTHQVQSFYNNSLKGTKDFPPLSPKTIKNLQGILNKSFSTAVSVGYLKVNPTTACTLPRIEKTEIKPLDDTQISEFLTAISGHKFETLYVTTLFTGMRQGEILGLPWSSIDLVNGTITVSQQLQLIKGTYKLLPVKNDKTRIITPAPSIIRLLISHKARQAELQLNAGKAWDNPDNLVFTNELGHHLSRETVYRNFKRIVKSLGYESTRFHDLRHSYAVASLQAGDDIKTVQENLGHHTAAFTLDTYAHVTDKMKRESADRMEKYMKKLGG